MAYQLCGAQSGPVPHRLSSDRWIQAEERLGPGLESPCTTPATTAPSAAREMLHAFGRGGHPSCNHRLYSSPWPCPPRLARRGGLTPGLAPREPSRASGPPQVAPTGPSSGAPGGPFWSGSAGHLMPLLAASRHGSGHMVVWDGSPSQGASSTCNARPQQPPAPPDDAPRGCARAVHAPVQDELWVAVRVPLATGPASPCSRPAPP